MFGTAGRSEAAAPQVRDGDCSINLWPSPGQRALEPQHLLFQRNGTFRLLESTPRLVRVTIIYEHTRILQGVGYAEPDVEYTVTVEDPVTGLNCAFIVTYYVPDTAFAQTGG